MGLMYVRVFQYILPAPDDLADLNAFLAGHRVAAVTHHVTPVPGGSMLVFVVQAVDGTSANAPPSRPKIDYRAELDDDDFAVFSRLRAWRKQAAEAEAVPVYTLFTNAQLAEMVKRRVSSAEALRAIEGVGAARVEKYGAAVVKILSALPMSEGAVIADAMEKGASPTDSRRARDP